MAGDSFRDESSYALMHLYGAHDSFPVRMAAICFEPLVAHAWANPLPVSQQTVSVETTRFCLHLPWFNFSLGEPGGLAPATRKQRLGVGWGCCFLDFGGWL